MWQHVPVKLEPLWRVSVFTHCCTGLLSSFLITLLCQWNWHVDVISLFTNVYRIIKQYKSALTSYICFLFLSWLQFPEGRPSLAATQNGTSWRCSQVQCQSHSLLTVCITYRMGLLNFLHYCKSRLNIMWYLWGPKLRLARRIKGVIKYIMYIMHALFELNALCFSFTLTKLTRHGVTFAWSRQYE